MMCGGYKWTITCGRNNTAKEKDPRECNNNTVTVTAPNGAVMQIKDPPITKPESRGRWNERQPWMFEETAPDSMQCVPVKGQYYVNLGCSRGSGGAGVFIDTFSANGTRYTSVAIPLQKGYKDPTEGINYRNLPPYIVIEGE